jgi:uncharacterized repeat protein (TIGR01451 family)
VLVLPHGSALFRWLSTGETAMSWETRLDRLISSLIFVTAILFLHSPASAAPLDSPDLVPNSLVVPTTAATGSEIEVSWTVVNQGTSSADTGWYDTLYFSTNNTWDSQDQSLGDFWWSEPVATGASYIQSQVVWLPQVPAGTYYLILWVDDGSYLGESNEANNQRVATVTITAPDLTPTALSAPSTAAAQEEISVTWTVENQGTAPANADDWGGWNDGLYLSVDSAWDTQDQHIADFTWGAPLTVGASYNQTQRVVLPQVQGGNYFLILRTDSSGYVFEADEANNTRAVALSITAPDLTPTALTAPLAASTQQSIEVSWTVKNQGTSRAEGGWYDSFYLSVNDVWDDQDQHLGDYWWGDPLALDASYSQTEVVGIPGVPAGEYHLILRTNQAQYLFELDTANNERAVPLTIITPDLTPTALTAPALASAGQQIELSWTVKNEGPGDARPEWYGYGWHDTFYLSTNNVWDAQDQHLGDFWYGDSVPAGSSYSHTEVLGLPQVAAGSYFLILRSDGGEQLYESNEANNQRAVALTIGTPDLSPTALTAPSVARAQDGLGVSWTVKNQGTGAVQGGWYDTFFLSTNATWDAQDHHLGDFWREETLAVDASVSWSETLFVPELVAGTYYLILHSDNHGNVFESDEANNQRAVAVTITTPDLTPTALTTPAVASAGQEFDVSWMVKNQGTGTAETGWYGYTWYDAIYFSADDAWDANDQQLGSFNWKGAVVAGAIYSQTQRVRLPQTPSGTYYLILRTDDANYLYEANEANNSRSTVVTLTIPDLRAASLSAPAVSVPGRELEVTWTVENRGKDQAPASWYDSLYLSTNNVWDEQDQHLGDFWWSESVPSGASYQQTQRIWIPGKSSTGSYFLILRSDSAAYLYESNEGNNEARKALELRNPESVTTPWRTLEPDEDGGQSLSHLDFSPDGGRIVAAGWDDAFLWDVQSGALRGRFTAHTAQINSVDFAPAGDYILSGASDGTARLWDASSRQQLRSFPSTTGQPNPAAYSADGTKVLAASGLGLPRLWDAVTGTELRRFTGHSAAVTAVALSPDGTRAVTGDTTGRVMLWNADTGARLSPLSAHTGAITAASFSPNGTMALTASQDGSIRLWNLASGTQAAPVLLQGTPVAAAAFSPDGGYVVSSDGDGWQGSAYLWEVASSALLRTFAPVDGTFPSVSGIAMSPDRSVVATTHSDGQVRLWQSGLETIPLNPVTPLAVGSSVTTTLLSHGLYYFEVDVEGGRNLVVTLEADSLAATLAGRPSDPTAARIVVGEGRVPSVYDYDYFAQAPLDDLHAEIPIAPTRTGKYYVLVFAPFLTDGSIDVRVRAEYTGLHLSDISPAQAGNAGEVSIEIEGTGFSDATTVTLISPSGQSVVATSSLLVSSTSFFVRFDLRAAQLGFYDVRVHRPSDGETSILQDAFQVVQGSGARLQVSLEGPDQVRPGRTYQYKLVYRNVGDADMPAPFLSVSTSGPGAILAAEGYTSTSTLAWLAPARDAPTLGPGQGGSISLAATFEDNIELVAGVVEEDDQPFDWESIEQRLRPEGVPDDSWNSSWATATTRIGSTNREVFGTLRSINYARLTPASLDDLIRFAVYVFAEEEVSSITQSPDSQQAGLGLCDYSYQLDSTDSEHFRLEDELGQPLNAGNFDTSQPTIFITHGRNSARDTGLDRFRDLAVAVQREFSTYNVVLVIWEEGADFPLVGVQVVTPFSRGLCVQSRSQILDDVAHAAMRKVSELSGGSYSKWRDSIYIGESFGNAVNAFMAQCDWINLGPNSPDSGCYTLDGNQSSGTSLILNAASPVGFALGARPDYQASFRESIAVQTMDVSDDGTNVGTRTALYLQPDCNGRDCGLIGASHISGIRYITCLLGTDDRNNVCGESSRIGYNPNLTKLLIKSDYRTLEIDSQAGFDACLDAPGNLYNSYSYVFGTCRGKISVVGGINITPQVSQPINVVRPIDPNDKVGPMGQGAQHLISARDAIEYTVNFENMVTATAPVQELVVVDYLDPNLDWSTFQFTELAYGSRQVSMAGEGNTLEFASRDFPGASDMMGTTEGQMAVDISASVNTQTGRVEWRLRAVDTATDQFPEDALAGFLPPEDGTGRGQGHVTFSVKPRVDVALGTRISNTASIVFDTNDPIVTNEVWNTIAAAADLDLGVQAAADAVLVGEEATFVVTINNDGPEAATGVRVSNSLPANLTLVSASPSQGTCTGSTTVTCNLGRLDDGTDATVTFVVRPTEVGAISFAASVEGDVVDFNTIDNAVTSHFNVTSPTSDEHQIFLPLVRRN